MKALLAELKVIAQAIIGVLVMFGTPFLIWLFFKGW